MWCAATCFKVSICVSHMCIYICMYVRRYAAFCLCCICMRVRCCGSELEKHFSQISTSTRCKDQSSAAGNWNFKIFIFRFFFIYFFFILTRQWPPRPTSDYTITVQMPSVGYTNANFWVAKKSIPKAHILKHIKERIPVSVKKL